MKPDLFEMTERQLDEYLEKETRKIIENAPEGYRPRLRGIAWKVDIIRAKFLKKGNKTGCMVAMSKLMMESVFELNKALQDLKSCRKQDKETKSD